MLSLTNRQLKITLGTMLYTLCLTAEASDWGYVRYDTVACVEKAVFDTMMDYIINKNTEGLADYQHSTVTMGACYPIEADDHVKIYERTLTSLKIILPSYPDTPMHVPEDSVTWE